MAQGPVSAPSSIRSRSGPHILIFGAGGHGKEVLTYLLDLRAAGQPLEIVGFIDEVREPGDLCGVPVIGGLNALQRIEREGPASAFHYITALGDNRARRGLVGRIAATGSSVVPWTVTHPLARVG